MPIPNRLVSSPFCLILALGLALAPALFAQKRPSAKDLVRGAEEDQRANRWEDAYKKLKEAAEQKPKDKKITDALQATAVYLADAAAARAVGFCNQKEIDKCESEAKVAAGYGDTPRVKEAQAKLASTRKEVQDQWNAAQAMITAGQWSEATAALQSLGRFSYMFPNLAAEKERVRTLWVASLLDRAGKEMAAQRWDSASDGYSAALRMDPGNNDASRGIESAKREKEASLAFQQARNALSAQGYEIAYDAVQKALKQFPNRQPYRDLEREIATAWFKVLIEEARKLSANTNSLADNQKAYDELQMARRLDPRNATVGEEMRIVRSALYSMYLQKASEHQAITDNSRIGLSYLYYVNAQQVNPSGEFALSANLREVSNTFQRKRRIQVVLSVENLSPAPPSFADVISRRIRANIDKLGLPDLALRTLDEYQKSPGEDPQFVESRPDAKSPTVQIVASLTDYESETLGNDKPIEKKSQFVAGQEMVNNPAYDQVNEEFMKVSAAMAREKPKPGKLTKEGYSAANLAILEKQLAATPRQILKDKLADYTYQEFHLKVRALVRMNLTVRDMLEKHLLGEEKIEVPQEQSQVEIAGVRDRDLGNLMNRTARLPQPSDMLRDCERKSLDMIDERVRKLMDLYLVRFYQEAENAARDGKMEDAVENLLCHWYLYRGRLPEAQEKRIREMVKKITGLDIV